MRCFDCPRNCGVELEEKSGFCGKDGKHIRVAKIMRHFWEEPVVSGKNGSGAVFFSFCSLKCMFCQNFSLSHFGKGKDLEKKEFCEILKKLENSNVENINFVTPTHYTSEILECLKEVKPSKTIVWNTSGYEKDIERLKGFVDVFLFDFKYFDEGLSFKLSKVKDYFSVCIEALKKAREIVPKDIVEDGILKNGIIIRHLVLPGQEEDSVKIFEEIKKAIGTDVFVSIMSQYTPMFKACETKPFDRRLRPLEYKKVLKSVERLGFEKGFVQEFSSATEDFTPDFENNFFDV